MLAAPDNRAGAGELALFLTASGRRDDARARLLQFLAANPRTKGRARLATYLSLVGAPDESVAILRDVLRESPDDAGAILDLARILVRNGRRDEAVSALASLERASAQGADARLTTRIQNAFALALTGRGDAARSAVAALLADADVARGGDVYDLACVVALTGDTTGALSLLQRAFAQGYKNLAWACLDPDLAPLAGRREIEELCRVYAAPDGTGDRPPPAR